MSYFGTESSSFDINVIYNNHDFFCFGVMYSCVGVMYSKGRSFDSHRGQPYLSSLCATWYSGFSLPLSPKPAAAKTLTQAGHVAPRFWVPRGIMSLGWGRTGGICYQYKNRD
jgi:hypothetical protein